MDDQTVHFLKSSFIQKAVDPLTRGQHSGFVPFFDPFRTSALFRQFDTAF
jgi:hypothetical protein